MKPFKIIILLFFIATLTACGFHLRGMQKSDYQIKTLAIQPNNPTEYFQRVFRRYLRDIDVDVTAGGPDTYAVRLNPEHYVREVLVIGTDAQAKQEYMLYTIYFEILSPISGALGEQSVQVNRMLNLDPSQILGQNQEETVMLNEMREEAALQIYYRVSVVAGREQSGKQSPETPSEKAAEKAELDAQLNEMKDAEAEVNTDPNK
jgi:LPS-assembly lipoprotein